MSTPIEMQAGVPQGSVLSPTLYNIYVNHPPQSQRIHLALFADDTCLYATDRKEGFIIRKLQRASAQLRPGVSAGTSKLMRPRHRGSTSHTVVDRLCLALH
jgi:hypothetical protein